MSADFDQERAAERLDERLRAIGGAEPTRYRSEARRLGSTMRAVIDRLVATQAPPEELAAAADQLEAIAARLAGYPKGRRYDGYAEAATAGDPGAFFDWSPLLGRANPLAPPLSVEVVDGRVVGRVRFGSAYEGPPGCAHGGFIAAAFDDVLGIVQSMSGHPSMTANLSVRYRKPTPLHADLTFFGTLLGVHGRKVTTSGELFAGEVLTAEAEALFISVNLGTLEELLAERQRRLGGPATPSA